MKVKDILTSPIKFFKDRFFKEYPQQFKDIPKDSGKVVEIDGEKSAIYKDTKGDIYKLSPYCTHLGCIVQWDDTQKRWECPCHRAKYSNKGEVVSGPAKKDLKKIDKPENEYYTIKILETEDLTHDVKRFKTTKPANYKFTPGQATEIAVNKVGFRDRFHPFTFTSLNEDDYLEFTIKIYPTDKYPEHSGVTEMIGELKEGDEFLIKDPVGTIEYQGEGVFIAGGAGITPFIAIFRDLKQRGKLDENMLIFSNKSKKDIILRDELTETFDNDNLILTLSREKLDKYVYGRVDRKLLEKSLDDFNQYFYICGPSGFEDDITKALVSLGAKNDKIIVEEW
jgi:hypothetical protein